MTVMSHDLGKKLIDILGIPGDVQSLDIKFEVGKEVLIDAKILITPDMANKIELEFRDLDISTAGGQIAKDVDAMARRTNPITLAPSFYATPAKVDKDTAGIEFSPEGLVVSNGKGDMFRATEDGFEVTSRVEKPKFRGFSDFKTPGVEAPKRSSPSIDPSTMVFCPLDSSHDSYVEGTECPDCRKTRQYRLNNLI